MTAPERIWAKGSYIDYDETRWHISKWNGGTEYIRADLATPAPAAMPPEVATEQAFMAAVWAALKADASDLGKQKRILEAFRAALRAGSDPHEQRD